MAQPRWLDSSEDRAWRGHLVMSQLLATQIERDLLRESGLSAADYAVLVNLSEDETHQVRATELADRMTWSKSRLSHQVARMEARGLVQRKGCGEDARGSYIALTQEGLETVRDAAPGHVESVRRHLLDHLTGTQIEMLGDISMAVIDHLSALGLTSPECSESEEPQAVE